MLRSGVRLVKLGPGKVRGRTATMPARGGTLDAPAASAVVAYGGGFKLRGQRQVAVRKLVLDIPGKRLRGRVGRRTLTIASLAKVTGALGLSGVFAGGHSLGRISTSVQPEAVRISAGTIALGGEASIFAKLESLGVEIGLWGTSSRFGETGPPVFLFEVANGELGPDASTGLISGESGLTLQRPQPYQDLLLLTPTVDLGSGVLSAGLARLSGEDPANGTIATLDTSASSLRIKDARRLELTGVKALTTQFLAERLNATFTPPTPFAAGEAMGDMSLLLYAQ